MWKWLVRKIPRTPSSSSTGTGRHRGRGDTGHPRLAQLGRVVLVDLKGFGQAPKPDDDAYDPATLARLVEELVREMEIDALTMIGHSLGGGVALLAALGLGSGPDSCLKRMVLVASATHPQRLPPLVPLSKRPRLTAAAVRIVGIERVMRNALRAIVHDPDAITDEQIAAYAHPLSTKKGLSAAMAIGRRILPENIEEITARYPEVDVPTLLLWGDSDPVIPMATARALLSQLPQAELRIVPRCGHLPQEEWPHEAWEMLRHFLSATEST